MVGFNIITNMTSLFLSIPGKDEKSAAPASKSSGHPVVAFGPPAPGGNPAAAPAVPAFSTQTPADFVRYNRRKSGNTRIAGLITDISSNRDEENDRTLPVWRRRQARINRVNYTSELGQNYILSWLYARNQGTANNHHVGRAITHLNQARTLRAQDRHRRIRYGNIDFWINARDRYWPAQLSMFLSSDLDSRYLRGQLRRLIGNNNGWYSKADPRLREKLALERIYQRYLSGRGNFLLMRAENLFRRALLAKALGKTQEYNSLQGQAETLLLRLLSKQNSRRLGRYVPYLVVQDRREKGIHFAWANQLMASILTLKKPPQLAQAIAYLTKTTALDGVAHLEARRLYADILLQQGYKLKNSDQPSAAKFRQAMVQLNYIIKWAKGYQRTIGKRTIPRWLANITVSARISKVKYMMVKAGELNGADKVGTLKAQKRKLQSISKIIVSILNATYGSRRIKLVGPEQRAELALLLGENLTRQAFIAKELHDNGSYLTLLTQAKKRLKTIFVPGSKASSLTRAGANLWLGKILLIQAGDAATTQDQLVLLNRAKSYIQNSLAGQTLRGSLRSSAYQTLGEILLAKKARNRAKDALLEAIRLDQQNYEARASLADILNQIGGHMDAIKQYNLLIAAAGKHLLLQRAKLGRAEAMMRQGENYSPQNIAALEKIVFHIMRNEPKGSYLIMRGIQALIEAYSTNEDLQHKIIIIGNVLLGRDFTRSAETKPFEDLVAKKIPFSTRFKAQLYLTLAEALSWKQDFTKAKQVLANLPSAIASFINSDQRLKLSLRLLKAELQMREKKKTTLIMDKALLGDILASGDPDLFNRIIFDRIEGFLVNKQFGEVIKLANKYLSPAELAKAKLLFKGRDRSFVKFKLRLGLSLATAHAWNAGSLMKKGKRTEAKAQYQKALDQFKVLLAEVNRIAKSYPPLSGLFNLIRVQVSFNRGEIYFSRREYSKAKTNYETAITMLRKMRSKAAKILLAGALISMGDIHRFVAKYQNFETAKKLYAEADKILFKKLPKNNLERIRLASRLKKSGFELRMMLGETSNVSPTFQFTCGSDGRCESQLSVGIDLSLGMFTPKLSWLNILLNGQMDSSNQIKLFTAYLGPRFHYKNYFSLEAQFKLGTCTDLYGCNAPSDAPEKIVFYRRPDLKLGLHTNFGTNYLSLTSAINIDYNDSRLNTYYTSVAFKLGWLKSRWLRGLGLKAEHNSFYFNYMGDFQERHSFAIGPQWKVNLYPEVWDLSVSLLGLAYSQRDSNNVWQQGGGLDLSIQTRVNLKKIFNYPVFLNLKYFHQHTPAYRINQGSVGIEIPF